MESHQVHVMIFSLEPFYLSEYLYVCSLNGFSAKKKEKRNQELNTKMSEVAQIVGF